MNNLRKFTTEADYSAATLNYPAVSWVVSEDIVHYDKTEPAPPTFSGLTVYYNIEDTSQPTELFKGGGGSGSGSGSGGVLPSAMIIDGTAVEVTNTYQFSTTGEHIVQYSFEANEIPNKFCYLLYYVATVEIGDSITSIGNDAFNECSSLTSIVIPNSVTSIGNNAFAYCYRLTSIDIPNSVTSIGDYTFEGCSGLTSCTIGSGVTSIGNNAFFTCRGLGSISIPDSVTSIGGGAFAYCTDLTSIDIPNSVTSISNRAFDGCTSLTSITSNATTAPTIQSNTFQYVKTNGTLYVPIGSSGYDTWMQNSNYYLGLYGWTKVEQ